MFKDNFNISHVYGQNLLEQIEQSNIKVIDIREPFELQICKLPDSLNIPMRQLLSHRFNFLNKEDTYYILCHTGQRSYYVCDELTKDGFNVVNIIGGIASIDKYNVPY